MLCPSPPVPQRFSAPVSRALKRSGALRLGGPWALGPFLYLSLSLTIPLSLSTLYVVARSCVRAFVRLCVCAFVRLCVRAFVRLRVLCAFVLACSCCFCVRADFARAATEPIFYGARGEIKGCVLVSLGLLFFALYFIFYALLWKVLVRHPAFLPPTSLQICHSLTLGPSPDASPLALPLWAVHWHLLPPRTRLHPAPHPSRCPRFPPLASCTHTRDAAQSTGCPVARAPQTRTCSLSRSQGSPSDEV